MSEKRASTAAHDQLDADFTILFEEVTNRLLGGQVVGLEELIAEYPGHERRLREFFPTMKAMADLGLSVSGPASSANRMVNTDVQQLGTLGDFHIKREIGRGGMGIVYEAEQISLNRRVALKVLPFAAVLNDKQLQRFKNEAQAAALLKHPNIVAVHSVGCERGVHYYAMELVDGYPLADLLAQIRSSTAKGDSSEETGIPRSARRAPGLGYASIETQPFAILSTQHRSGHREYYRSMARLIAEAAEALQYAHGEGIIHRDVKPSNVLLDRQGKLWITDFGLAHVQTGQNLTMTGDLLGTLRYMSPEQAAGRRYLDHRSDVYSLGVTLYELVTLQPPFTADNRQMLLRQVAEEQPPHPRQRNQRVPADLETIVLKAMSKEPEARYQTAQELADDLKRFLARRPIHARRAGHTDRLWRWVRRNPVFAALIALVAVLLLILATAGPVVAVRQATLAAREAAARQAADEARTAAERDRLSLQQMLDRALRQTALALTTMRPHQRQLLRESLDFYETLLHERGDDPKIRFEAAVAFSRLGRVYNLTDQPSRGFELYQKSFHLLNALVSEYPSEQRFRLELAVAHFVLAGRETTEADQSLEHYRRSIELARALVTEDPREADYHRRLGYSQCFYGAQLERLGLVRQAQRHMELAIDAWQQLVDSFGKQGEDLLGLAYSKWKLGALLMASNHFDEAQRELSETVGIVSTAEDSIRQLPERMAGVASGYVDYGRFLLSVQQPKDAESYIRDAIVRTEELLSDYPHISWGRQARASACEALSDTLLCLGRKGEAEETLQSALLQWRELAQSVPDDRFLYERRLAWTYCKLGELLWWTGRREDARGQFWQARSRLERLESNHSDDTVVKRHLARLLVTCPASELRDAERGAHLAEAVLQPEVGTSWQLLGAACYRAGMWHRAIQALGKGMESRMGGDAFDWLLLAMTHSQVGNPDEATRWFHRAARAIDQAQPVGFQNFGHSFHLRDLRDEAETLIGGSAQSPRHN